MVEVFRTNVSKKKDANRLCLELSQYIADSTINFDLEDCDRVLRIEYNNDEVNFQEVINLLSTQGFMCEILND